MKTNLIHLFIPIGCASCGKSTYYTKLTEKFKTRFPIIRISADDIRFDLLDYEHTGKDYDEKIEPQVWKKVYEIFDEILSDPISTPIGIYFDCTNLTVKERSQIIIRALRSHATKDFYDKQLKQTFTQEKRNEIQIHFIVFNTPLAQCLLWNNNRKRHVPDKVIAQQYCRYERPSDYEFNTWSVIEYDEQQNQLRYLFPPI